MFSFVIAENRDRESLGMMSMSLHNVERLVKWKRVHEQRIPTNNGAKAIVLIGSTLTYINTDIMSMIGSHCTLCDRIIHLI